MLGIILAPYGQIPGAYPSGINYSYGPNGQYLGPADASYHTHGEPGEYHDTQLGGPSIPTDDELGRQYGYTPYNSGWVAFKDNYWPAPWVPPAGWRPNGNYGPGPTLRGLGDDPAVQVTPNDMIAALNAHNARIFALSAVSTLVVSVSALLTIWRTARLLRAER